jgi:hypothetical protein
MVSLNNHSAKKYPARRTEGGPGFPAVKSGRAEGRSSVRQIDFKVAVRFGVTEIEVRCSMAPSLQGRGRLVSCPRMAW